MNKVLFIGFIFIRLLFAPGITTADGPEPVDECANAPVLEPGTHSTTITPNGAPLFKVDEMSRGDFISFDVEYDVNRFETLVIIGASHTETSSKSTRS